MDILYKRFHLLAFLLILFVNNISLSAQNNYRTISFQSQIGVTFFNGDVDSKNGWESALGLRYSFSRAIAVKFLYSKGLLQGIDRYGNNNRHFKNEYTKYATLLELNILAIFNEQTLSKYFYPYAEIGMGFMNSSVVDVTQSSNPEIAGVLYQGSDFFYQVGAGFKVYLSNRFDFLVNASYNIAQTDWIDGHNPDIAANQYNDYFGSISGGLTIKLGSKNKSFADWHFPHVDFDKTYEANVIEEQVPEIDAEANEVNDKKVSEPVITVAPVNESVSDVSEPHVNKVTTNKETLSAAIREDRIEREEYPDIAKLHLYHEKLRNLDGTEANQYFHIIGGAFRVRENAFHFVDELNNRGFHASIITNGDGTLYRISMEAFDDYQTASRILKYYRKQLDPNAWIVYNIQR
jgi:Outer membrane protein beta-barrel domain/SPOR domain